MDKLKTHLKTDVLLKKINEGLGEYDGIFYHKSKTLWHKNVFICV